MKAKMRSSLLKKKRMAVVRDKRATPDGNVCDSAAEEEEEARIRVARDESEVSVYANYCLRIEDDGVVCFVVIVGLVWLRMEEVQARSRPIRKGRKRSEGSI